MVGRVIDRIAPVLGVAPVDEDAEPERDVLLVEASGGGKPNAAF